MNWIGIGATNLALAVILGAFGAHGLKHKVSTEQLLWWSTATEYYFFHALGLLIIGILLKLNLYKVAPSAWLIQIGIMLFCGSLFLMTLGAPRFFGMITPVGGICFILGWLFLAFKAFTA